MKPRVKICGITNTHDAIVAADAGAHFLGYIFYAPSKRFVAPRSAREIVAAVRQEYPDIQHVGVFVDETEDNVVWTRALAGLDLVQLHGTESPEMCTALADTGVEVIKSLGYHDRHWTIDITRYNVPYFLCDTHDPVKKGGTGKRFDISALPPALDLSKTFLAGGLTPENVSGVFAEIMPFAVDVSSGVEDAPGKKNHKRVQEFINSVRQSQAVLSKD